MVSIDGALGFFKPVEVLLLEDEAAWSFADEVIVFVEVLVLAVKFSEDFESSSQISLFDLVLTILIILVGELVYYSLPLLKKLRRT